MMPLSGLVEMALFSNPAACFSSSGVSDGTQSCPSYSPALISLLQSVQFTRTSGSRRSITPGACLTWEGTKGPSSEQQGQFTAPVAAIHSWRHLTHTSAPHCSSSGCERMLEHSAHFSSFNINWLFMLAKGGLGSRKRTGGGAIFSR